MVVRTSEEINRELAYVIRQRRTGKTLMLGLLKELNESYEEKLRGTARKYTKSDVETAYAQGRMEGLTDQVDSLESLKVRNQPLEVRMVVRVTSSRGTMVNAVCPMCNGTLAEGTIYNHGWAEDLKQKNRFCPYCGQRLGWEGE